MQQLGRDVVATWLNFLAGNPIGNDSGPSDTSPKAFLNDAIDWLQTWGGKAGNGVANNLADNVKTETFDVYDSGHTAVKTSTAQWGTAQFAGDPHTAAQMHSALDFYNNTGSGVAMSADDPFDAMLINASQGITP